jgi:hypothetical protein
MIKDTIEQIKTFVEKNNSLNSHDKLKLQSMLTEVRGELLTIDYMNVQTLARLDVYADIANKILDRLADRS